MPNEFNEMSFRLGCGRYLQGAGAISALGGELAVLGCRKPFIMGGETALSLTREQIEKSLAAASIEAEFRTYRGFCCQDICTEIIESADFKECDSIVGVGGGNVMDAAKNCADRAGKPIINIPTSSATCAAFTPLSICYTREGRTVGTSHHPLEVNCVIADTDILCRQPVRLLLAGIYDALAKLFEMRQRVLDIGEGERDIALSSACHLSGFAAETLSACLDECVADVEAARNTKLVSDMIWIVIALTGVISGLTRGMNQTAIAHRIYYTLRTLFPSEVSRFLHGELVAMGLIVQIAYNGEGDPIDFREKMRSLGMPVRFSDIGVEPSESNISEIRRMVIASNAMTGATDADRARFAEALLLLE